MASIAIDGKDYNLDLLSDDAKSHLTSLHFVDSELARLQGQAAVLQTARVAYARALSELLPKDSSEVIKLS